jgi:hypothetical protein
MPYPQVLVIPAAGGATVPAVQPPSRREILEMMLSHGMSMRVAKRKYARLEGEQGAYSKHALRGHLVRGLSNQQAGCCPCPDQGNPPYPIQQPGEPWPLNQPPGPRRPFQLPADPCTPTIEALARMGLTPQMLKDCLGGERPQRMRRSSIRKRRKKGRRQPTRRAAAPTSRRPRRKAKSRMRLSPSGGLRKLRNGACWDSRTGRFVKRALCA